MKTNILIAMLAIGLASFGQSNKEAEALLKEVRQKTEAYESQSITYINEIEAPTGNANNPMSSRRTRGSAQIKGQKYRVDMGGFLLIHDGAKTFMVYPDDEEINVVDTEDQEINLTPAGILSSYEKGYSYAMAGKETVNGKTIQYIRMRPKAAADVKEIMLGIDMSSKQLYSYKQFAHDGVITTLTVEKYVVNTDLSNTLFSITAPEFEGFDIYRE